MKNERFKKHIALFVITLIIVSSVPGTLVFASDSDAYSYSNSLLYDFTKSIINFNIINYSACPIINGSYFVGDQQSNYFYPELNYCIVIPSDDADRIRFCLDVSPGSPHYDYDYYFLILSQAGLPNVFDIRCYSDFGAGCDVVWWFNHQDDYVIVLHPNDITSLSGNLNVDFYISDVGRSNYALTNNSVATSILNNNANGCLLGGWNLSQVAGTGAIDILTAFETIHAINNLAHVFSFQEAQISDILNTNDDIYTLLDSIYKRMSSIVSSSWSSNTVGNVILPRRSNAYYDLLTENITQSTNYFRFTFNSDHLGSVMCFRVKFTDEVDVSYITTYSMRSFVYDTDNPGTVLDYYTSHGFLYIVIDHNLYDYISINVELKRNNTLDCSSLLVQYVPDLSPVPILYDILNAINNIEFSYPDSAGDQTINNVNVNLDLDLEAFKDIEINYNSDLDNAAQQIDLQAYKPSQQFLQDLNNTSDLIQHMFIMSLSVNSDQEDSDHNLSIGILIIISLILFIILAFFRRTRS